MQCEQEWSKGMFATRLSLIFSMQYISPFPDAGIIRGAFDFDFDFDSFISNPTCGVAAPALRVVCPNEVLRPAPF